MIRKFIRKITGTEPPAPPEKRAPDFVKPKDNWQVGDIAECIIQTKWHKVTFPFGLVDAVGPDKGDQMRVTACRVAPHPLLGKDHVWLSFRQWPGETFSATAFRKVIPTHDKAESDEGITLEDLIGKPVRVREAERR